MIGTPPQAFPITFFICPFFPHYIHASLRSPPHPPIATIPHLFSHQTPRKFLTQIHITKNIRPCEKKPPRNSKKVKVFLKNIRLFFCPIRYTKKIHHLQPYLFTLRHPQCPLNQAYNIMQLKTQRTSVTAVSPWVNWTPKVGQVKHYWMCDTSLYLIGLIPFNFILILLLL